MPTRIDRLNDSLLLLIKPGGFHQLFCRGQTFEVFLSDLIQYKEEACKSNRYTFQIDNLLSFS